MQDIAIEPLNAESFRPFGNVLAATGDFRMINDGMCCRYNDLAQLDFAAHGRVGISIFDAKPRPLPYEFDLIERHPHGAQAFLPLSERPFLVIVATNPDSRPRAFATNGRQGINFHRGTWHGVLTPLHAPGLFAVVDWIGDTPNLEEYRYSAPFRVIAG